MRLATKLGTTGAIALVGAGVALGVLAGGSHSAPSAPVVVQRVADTSAAPTAAQSTARPAVRLAKPAAANDAPITAGPTTAPSATPTDAPAPALSQQAVDVGPGTVDSKGSSQPPSALPPMSPPPTTPQATIVPSASGTAGPH